MGGAPSAQKGTFCNSSTQRRYLPEKYPYPLHPGPGVLFLLCVKDTAWLAVAVSALQRSQGLISRFSSLQSYLTRQLQTVGSMELP